MDQKISPKVIGAIIATGLMSFSGVVIETAMNITFPTLMKEFNVPTNLVQWMTTIYLLVVAALVPLSATLKRRFKMKSLFLVAISLFIIGVITDGLAPVFGVLLLGRAIQGLGTGIALPLMFNIILEQVPMSKRGTMMGIGTLITGVAPAVGPTFGGIVVATMGWRYIFAFLLPLLVIALVLGITCIQQKTPTSAASVDQLSVILIVLTFCGLIFGISNFGSSAFLSINVVGALVIGLIGLGLFIWRSRQLPHPVLDLSLLKNRGFSANLLAFSLIQITSLGLSFLLPNYIQLVNGQSALAAGLIVLPGAALGAVMSPLGGQLYDSRGARVPLRVGSILSLIGMVGLSIWGSHLNVWGILCLYTFFMLGVGTHYGNLMTNGLKQLTQTQNSDGNAIFNTAQQFMAALGTSIASAMVAAAQATAHTQAIGTAIGSEHAFLVLTVLIAAELIIVCILTKQKVRAID